MKSRECIYLQFSDTKNNLIIIPSQYSLCNFFSGGWNDSKGNKYSRLVNDPKARKVFTKHVIEYLKEHNFDGLDLDWEYPKCWQVDCKQGPVSDKKAFADWVQELSRALHAENMILSAAVSPSAKVSDHD